MNVVELRRQIQGLLNSCQMIDIDTQSFFELSPASLQKNLDRCFDILKVTPRKHPNIKSRR